MLAFPLPKNPESTAWYQMRFPEGLAGTPSVIIEPDPASAIPLTVEQAQLADDGISVRFLVGGGSDGTVWILDVHVTTADGSALVVPVRLSVADQ